MLNRGHLEERERKSLCLICLFRREATLPGEVANKSYPSKYKVPKFQYYDGKKGNTMKHVVRFLNLMGPFAHNVDFYLNDFSKSPIDRIVNWVGPAQISDVRSE